jgi:3-hydroxy-9,10-secoandrosta-1,3,5(10)-triene-9,17-dione monooxygenase reductase component
LAAPPAYREHVPAPEDADLPGSSLRYGNPWADPPAERDPVRQARARLAAPVTVWTAGDSEWAGLTVSSLVLAQGQPGRLLGLIGPESDLADAIERTGRFVVHLLADRREHRRLAQHFAGSLHAEAELLQIETSPHGPRLLTVPDQLACRVRDHRPCGWSELFEAEIDEARLGPPRPGLLWQHGEFRHWS